jgi:hypothetical protein
MRDVFRARRSRGREETDRCIVSLATDHGSYPLGGAYPLILERLGQSLRQVGFSGEFRAWPPGNFPSGCPPHLDVPFAFKPFCIADARAHGRSAVLWLDSSCVVIRSLDPIFEAIETNGYVLFKNGTYNVGEWASDLALSEFGLTRERALTLPEVSAGAIGLSFNRRIGVEFFEAWFEAANKATAFRGTDERLASWADYEDVKWNRSGRASSDPRVHGHRHDQTVAGILADRFGMELTLDGLEDYLVMGEGTQPRPATAIVIDRYQDYAPTLSDQLPPDPPRPFPADPAPTPGDRVAEH